MPQVLFVCTGNICRSAFAERYARTLAGTDSDWTFASAGIGALVGEPLCPTMAAELESRGGSAEGFAARQISREIIQGADAIFTMDHFHRSYILDDFPAKVRTTFALGHFWRMFSDSGRQTTGMPLVSEVASNRSRPIDTDTIEDPYRRGPEVAARVATRLTEILDRVVPQLVQG